MYGISIYVSQKKKRGLREIFYSKLGLHGYFTGKFGLRSRIRTIVEKRGGVV
jgi:hypothetical protein